MDIPHSPLGIFMFSNHRCSLDLACWRDTHDLFWKCLAEKVVKSLRQASFSPNINQCGLKPSIQRALRHFQTCPCPVFLCRPRKNCSTEFVPRARSSDRALSRAPRDASRRPRRGVPRRLGSVARPDGTGSLEIVCARLWAPNAGRRSVRTGGEERDGARVGRERFRRNRSAGNTRGGVFVERKCVA